MSQLKIQKLALNDSNRRMLTTLHSLDLQDEKMQMAASVQMWRNHDTD